MRKPGFPLVTLPGFSGEASRKLADFNITTIEEFVSLTNSEEMRRRVSTLLALDDATVEEMRRVALSSLPEDLRKEMENPADTSMFGLGALDPKTDK